MCIRAGVGFALLACLLLAPAARAAESFAPLDRPGPALSVPTKTLDDALECTPGLAGAKRAPVLLSPATGVTPDQNYEWNYERALTARGIPWCAITMPFRTLGDIQIAAEYLVRSIRTMRARSGRRIAIIGHSQGGMSMRWALRFWPDTRAMVDDVIGLAASNHGTNAGGGCERFGCPPASLQQQDGSKFIEALNSRTETFRGISYTEVYTRTDEVVTPNQDDSGSSSLRTGEGRITNVAIQEICPNDRNGHLQIGTVDYPAYALAMDALDHDGPASEARIDRAVVCSQPFQPGVDPLSANTYIQVVSAVPGLLGVAAPVNVVGAPTTREEPPLRCYVRAAACPGAPGGGPGAGCFAGRGAARGTRLGPLRLGSARASLRRRLGGRRASRRAGIDLFCVAGGGVVEIGYPTRRSPRGVRRSLRDRAVLVLASSRRFSVSGVRRGASVASLRRRVRGERRFRVGRNTWFVARSGKVVRLFRTRRGRVLSVGVGRGSLNRGPRATRRFLRTWQL